jgi:hypothetical protein
MGNKRNRGRDLSTAPALADAHAELENFIRTRSLERSFVSLASKALWLCWPEHVPIFDAYAQRSLWFLSKIGAIPINSNWRPCHQFAAAWVAVYDKCKAALDELEIPPSCYRVRVFDTLLWKLGKPDYYAAAETSRPSEAATA